MREVGTHGPRSGARSTTSGGVAKIQHHPLGSYLRMREAGANPPHPEVRAKRASKDALSACYDGRRSSFADSVPASSEGFDFSLAAAFAASFSCFFMRLLAFALLAFEIVVRGFRHPVSFLSRSGFGTAISRQVQQCHFPAPRGNRALGDSLLCFRRETAAVASSSKRKKVNCPRHEPIPASAAATAWLSLPQRRR